MFYRPSRVAALLLAAGLASFPISTGAAAARLFGNKVFKPVPSNTSVNLTMVSYLPVISATANSTLSGLISGFERLHPNIHVSVQSASATTGPAVAALVQQDEAAGDQPDVVQLGLDSLRYFVNALGAKNLNRIAGASQLASEWGGDHPYAPAIRALGTLNKIPFAVPWTLSSPVLFYNASLFQKAGLNPADPPTTWTELMADAEKIKQTTGAAGLSTCIAGSTSGNVDWCTQGFIFSAGGKVLSAPTKPGPKLTFNNSRTIYAMKVLQQLGESGAIVNVTTGQSIQEFGQGKLAMVMNSSAAQALLLSAAGTQFQVLDAKMPAFGTEKTAPTNSGSALAVLSTDSVRQRASWELIKYLTSDAAQTAITENIGYAPLRPTLTNDPKYLASWSHTQTLLTPNLDQLKHIVQWEDYPGSNWGQIEMLLETAAANIAFQGDNPAATMDQLESQASSLVK